MPLLLIHLISCATLPPKNSSNLCMAFSEKEDWYGYAKQSSDKWGIPIAVQMAIMYQESHFIADAEPARPWLLGVVPWFKESSAYGYAQAKDETWDDYLKSTGNWRADRDDFEDAADFIGWYCHLSHIKLGIATTDTKNLYLAYHEGHRGYQSKSYLKKAWLRKIADKVASQAKSFQYQLNGCQMN